MRTYTVNLTSNQTIGLPVFLNGATLSGYPGSTRVLSSFPMTADGNFFHPTSAVTAFYNDGSFFPWEYVISTYNFSYPAINLKGPYTVVFSTSGLDSSLFGILKILYDFGDGTKKNVNYPVGDQFSGLSLITRPGDQNISKDYYPTSLSATTYTPSITVINGDLVSYVFSIPLTFYPGSIYDFDDIHLLNSVSIGVSSNELLNIFETRSPNYITHTLALSA